MKRKYLTLKNNQIIYNIVIKSLVFFSAIKYILCADFDIKVLNNKTTVWLHIIQNYMIKVNIPLVAVCCMVLYHKIFLYLCSTDTQRIQKPEPYENDLLL